MVFTVIWNIFALFLGDRIYEEFLLKTDPPNDSDEFMKNKCRKLHRIGRKNFIDCTQSMTKILLFNQIIGEIFDVVK